MISNHKLSKTAGLLILFAATEASAVSIQGRATGSFCCIIDTQGNLDTGQVLANGDIVNNTGSARFTISNHDEADPATGSSTAKVTWGTASQNPGDPSNPLNYFEFDGNGSDAGSLPGSTMADTLFQIGTFDYYNASTRQDKISALSFNLDMQIINNDVSMSFPTLSFDFAIDNTNDNSDPEASKDTVNLVDASLIDSSGMRTSIWGSGPMLFELDGINYSFILNGFAVIDPLTGLPELDANGDFLFSTGTSAYEDSLTSAGIFGTIQQVSAVPLPAAAWLFGSGLLALGALLRKKTTA